METTVSSSSPLPPLPPQLSTSSNNESTVTILAKKYQIIAKIGSGSFGEIYLGRNIRTSEEVAIKVENRAAVEGTSRQGKSQLKREAKVYAKMFGEGMEFVCRFI